MAREILMLTELDKKDFDHAVKISVDSWWELLAQEDLGIKKEEIEDAKKQGSESRALEIKEAVFPYEHRRFESRTDYFREGQVAICDSTTKEILGTIGTLCRPLSEIHSAKDYSEFTGNGTFSTHTATCAPSDKIYAICPQVSSVTTDNAKGAGRDLVLNRLNFVKEKGIYACVLTRPTSFEEYCKYFASIQKYLKFITSHEVLGGGHVDARHDSELIANNFKSYSDWIDFIGAVKNPSKLTDGCQWHARTARQNKFGYRLMERVDGSLCVVERKSDFYSGGHAVFAEYLL